jgi:hypothetical protein
MGTLPSRFISSWDSRKLINAADEFPVGIQRTFSVGGGEKPVALSLAGCKYIRFPKPITQPQVRASGCVLPVTCNSSGPKRGTSQAQAQAQRGPERQRGRHVTRLFRRRFPLQRTSFRFDFAHPPLPVRNPKHFCDTHGPTMISPLRVGRPNGYSLIDDLGREGNDRAAEAVQQLLQPLVQPMQRYRGVT